MWTILTICNVAYYSSMEDMTMDCRAKALAYQYLTLLDFPFPLLLKVTVLLTRSMLLKVSTSAWNSPCIWFNMEIREPPFIIESLFFLNKSISTIKSPCLISLHTKVEIEIWLRCFYYMLEVIELSFSFKFQNEFKLQTWTLFNFIIINCYHLVTELNFENRFFCKTWRRLYKSKHFSNFIYNESFVH